MATDDDNSPNSNSNIPYPESKPQPNGRPKRKWYKDKTYLFMIGVFALAAGLLIVQAQQQQFNRHAEIASDQLLVGQNQTLVLVNKTALALSGNGVLIPGEEPGTLEGLKNLLTSINQTLSNPNRTVNTKNVNCSSTC